MLLVEDTSCVDCMKKFPNYIGAFENPLRSVFLCPLSKIWLIPQVSLALNSLFLMFLIKIQNAGELMNHRGHCIICFKNPKSNINNRTNLRMPANKTIENGSNPLELNTEEYVIVNHQQSYEVLKFWRVMTKV